MFSRILMPTDGSETAQKAAEDAIELARRLHSSVVILSVIDLRFHISQTVPSAAAAGTVRESIEDYLRESAEVYAEEIRKQCDKYGIESKVIVTAGHPVEEIIKEAGKSESTLVVMGSHGRSVLAAAVLGSVTYGVINKGTKTPVLVIRK